MKFQPGDQVSFINEKQQGVVTKLLGNNMVIVEIEDGFEFPVRENELVKIGTMQVDVPVAPSAKEIPVVQDMKSLMDICPEKAIVVAAVPDATGAVLTGPLTYYLVNRSEFDLLFTFYCRKETVWKGIHRGVAEKASIHDLVHFKREELIDIQSFLLQGLLYSETELNQVSTLRNEFGVLLPGINNARNDLTGLAAFAAVVNVFTGTHEEPVPVKDLLAKFHGDEKSSSQGTKHKTSSPPTRSPGKYGILETEKEVDLHIEELVPDVSGLSNAEMMEIQLRRFSKEMDQALRNHFRKMIFIHGVGNGKLKNEIRKELRHYPNVAFKDADSRKYGQGATEVTFM